MKILIVEDVEYNRDLLVQLLEEDYELVTAADGAAGIEAAARERPDLILMDLSLPGVDGREATRRLKAPIRDRKHPGDRAHPHAMQGDEDEPAPAAATTT